MTRQTARPIPKAVARIAPDGKPTPRQRRQIMIELCMRRFNPDAIISPELSDRRTAVNDWPDLRPVLRGLMWAVAGGVATRAYMPERTTQDIDILVRREDCQAAWQRFQDAGYRVAEVLDAPYFVARTLDGIEVDVMCADFPWTEPGLIEHRLDPAGYPVLDLPYLVLMKLMSNRGVDIGDMTRMLGLALPAELERVREAVERYAPQDLDDLEALILLGQMELGDVR